MTQRVSKGPKGLRKLGNLKKIPELLGFDGEYSAGHPKDKFDICARKLLKLSCRTFHRKTFLT